MSALAPNRDSVTTINDDGSRRMLHPASVRGRFTKWRSLVARRSSRSTSALPWIPINGYPAVFLDLEHRSFTRSADFRPAGLVVGFFLVSGLGFSLFFLTSLLGRVWCGWACPQTTFFLMSSTASSVGLKATHPHSAASTECRGPSRSSSAAAASSLRSDSFPSSSLTSSFPTSSRCPGSTG